MKTRDDELERLRKRILKGIRRINRPDCPVDRARAEETRINRLQRRIHELTVELEVE